MNQSNPSSAGTPILRISRPIAACSRCRRAKIKCDGKLPACSACEKAGYAKSCASPVAKSVDGNEKSYVACLESRVRELEEKISFSMNHKTTLNLKDPSNLVKFSERKELEFTQSAPADGKLARRREVADVNKLVSDFGFLSINATTHDFEEATTSMTFARLILAAATNESLPDYGLFTLPPKSIARALADYYIDNILCFFPIFDEEILLNVLESIYQHNLQLVSESGHWLFYMTLAISSISQSRNYTDRFYKDAVICIRKALSFADRVLVPGCVSQIQALVLLVQYSMLDPAHFDSWILTGITCRAIVDLGFHQDPPKDEPTDQKSLELRRTLFYSIYSLDRSVSMVHARSFSFTDDSTSVTFPSIKNEKLPVDTKLKLGRKFKIQSSLLFKLRKIQSSWYHELFQSKNDFITNPSTYIQKVCQEMQAWAQSIPEYLPTHIKNYFDLELLYSLVYCLAPSSRVKVVPTWAKTLKFESSIKYIEKITAINQASSNFTFFTYHDALRVYFVGSQFLSTLQEDQEFPDYSAMPPDFQLKDFFYSFRTPCAANEDNLHRALCCIIQIRDILKTFSHRWQDSRVLLSSVEPQLDYFAGILGQRKCQHE
ncbi:Positive regulator of purine utilization [Erysiphe necator]|nr:Positive regulator of purine utilization [Erysiphe necator]